MKKRRLRRHLKKYKFFYFFILIISLIIVVVLINDSKPIYEKKISAELNVGKTAGFNLNKTILSFGTIIPSSTSKRQLKLENNYTFPVIFEFNIEGNISDFLIFDEKTYLEPGKVKTIDINAIGNSNFGNYSGKMIIKVKKIGFISKFFN